MRAPIVFVTYFNSFYLVKALCMYRSLKRHLDGHHRFLFYCYDHESLRALKRLGAHDINAISISVVETWSKVNKSKFLDRTAIEYMFTMTPYILRHARSIYNNARVVYVDADYYFYSSPGHILDITENAVISFVEHGFPEKYSHLVCHGKYNVGWNSFSSTRESDKLLNKWCQLTSEWCYDRVELGRYADQRYLELLAAEASSFMAISSLQMGIAEYNFFQQDLRIETDPRGNFYIKSANDEIISWHHHGVVERENGEVDIRVNIQEARQSVLYMKIYAHYIDVLRKERAHLAAMGINLAQGNSRLCK